MAPTTQKTSDKNQITDEDRKPGVVYVGHVPHGFYEKQLRQYFSQFGTVLAIKLSRSPKTGKSKGYAFIKFRYAAVAKTVAETCQNYLFFNRLLKCEYKPLSEVHESTFFSYKWKANFKNKRLHNSAKTEEKVAEKLQKSATKKQSKLNKLQEMGIHLKLDNVMDVPEIAKRKPKPKKDIEDKVPDDVEQETTSKTTEIQQSRKKLKRGSKSNLSKKKFKKSAKSPAAVNAIKTEPAVNSTTKSPAADKDITAKPAVKSATNSPVANKGTKTEPILGVQKVKKSSKAATSGKRGLDAKDVLKTGKENLVITSPSISNESKLGKPQTAVKRLKRTDQSTSGSVKGRKLKPPPAKRVRKE